LKANFYTLAVSLNDLSRHMLNLFLHYFIKNTPYSLVVLTEEDIPDSPRVKYLQISKILDPEDLDRVMQASHKVIKSKGCSEQLESTLTSFFLKAEIYRYLFNSSSLDIFIDFDILIFSRNFEAAIEGLVQDMREKPLAMFRDPMIQTWQGHDYPTFLGEEEQKIIFQQILNLTYANSGLVISKGTCSYAHQFFKDMMDKTLRIEPSKNIEWVAGDQDFFNLLIAGAPDLVHLPKESSANFVYHLPEDPKHISEHLCLRYSSTFSISPKLELINTKAFFKKMTSVHLIGKVKYDWLQNLKTLKRKELIDVFGRLRFDQVCREVKKGIVGQESSYFFAFIYLLLGGKYEEIQSVRNDPQS
jgi:hypothetical protein